MAQKLFSTVKEFHEGKTKMVWSSLEETYCDNLFQSEMVLGKNEYLWIINTRRWRNWEMCQSQNVESYEHPGEVSYMELQKGYEHLCKKKQAGEISRN